MAVSRADFKVQVSNTNLFTLLSYLHERCGSSGRRDQEVLEGQKEEEPAFWTKHAHHVMLEVKRMILMTTTDKLRRHPQSADNLRMQRGAYCKSAADRLLRRVRERCAFRRRFQFLVDMQDSALRVRTP